MTKLPTDISVILTYRCPMKCRMCNIWQYPTEKEKELTIEDLRILPKVKFINLTGGEPFIREDLEDIVELLYTKSPRIVISTSGWFKDRVISLAKKFPQIGIRVSLEGMKDINDKLRGREGGFERGLSLLKELKELGLKDIGFGITVGYDNSTDMLNLYGLSRELGMEFATAAVHNSYYFHKYDNCPQNKPKIKEDFTQLIESQLRENNPKSWFRAYFNMGLVNYTEGGKRLLPCEAGTQNIFIDPYGEIFPCNGMEESIWMESMGNLRSGLTFDQIWESEKAKSVRDKVACCEKNCWMIGTVSPVMKKKIQTPLKWVLANKLRILAGKPVRLCKSK